MRNLKLETSNLIRKAVDAVDGPLLVRNAVIFSHEFRATTNCRFDLNTEHGNVNTETGEPYTTVQFRVSSFQFQ